MEPVQLNGPILYYLIEWTNGNEIFSANVSAELPLSFKFPNTSTTTGTFNVSIQAINNAGFSDPYTLQINPNNDNFYIDYQILGILIGIFVSLLAVLLCIWIFLRKKHCSKHNNHQHEHQNASNAPSLLPPGQQSLNCTAEVHEMQTLITRPSDTTTSIATIVPNGNLNHLNNHGFIKQRPDVTNVNETRTLNNEKLLKVSPKLRIHQHELEPLTNGSDTITDTPFTGVTKLTTFQPKSNGRWVNDVERPQDRQDSDMSKNGYVKPKPPLPVSATLSDAKTYKVEPISVIANPQPEYIPKVSKRKPSNSSIYSSGSSSSSSSGSTVVVSSKNSQVMIMMIMMIIIT